MWPGDVIVLLRSREARSRTGLRRGRSLRTILYREDHPRPRGERTPGRIRCHRSGSCSPPGTPARGRRRELLDLHRPRRLARCRLGGAQRSGQPGPLASPGARFVQGSRCNAPGEYAAHVPGPSRTRPRPAHVPRRRPSPRPHGSVPPDRMRSPVQPLARLPHHLLDERQHAHDTSPNGLDATHLQLWNCPTQGLQTNSRRDQRVTHFVGNEFRLFYRGLCRARTKLWKHSCVFIFDRRRDRAMPWPIAQCRLHHVAHGFHQIKGIAILAETGQHPQALETKQGPAIMRIVPLAIWNERLYGRRQRSVKQLTRGMMWVPHPFAL